MPKKILIVEENVLMLDVMAYILISNGYDVLALPNAAGIFNFIKTSHPDLLIIDAVLSGIDGRDICQLIKLNRTTRNLPVIMCTDETAAHSRHIITRGAPDDILEKPFDINLLIKKVEYQLAA